MKPSRRDMLALLAGGCMGGAAATATGLYHYYTNIKPYHTAGPGAPAVSAPDPDGWVLTHEDMTHFAEADSLIESGALKILDNTDIPGSGDFQMMRVRNLGDCVEACEASSECQAFTYARSNHVLPAKRQMCWLKAEQPADLITDVVSYVSGRR